MAKAKAAKTYIVTVKNNPTFCGVGAGGAQFAQGKARGVSERLANWYKEHPGYEVEEAKAEEPKEEDAPADSKK